ncbi:MAG: hypothetical protein KTR31_17805 [Myxococcales bacterium]|nr:hypothetical protein [Myxococcales bacterium]
MDDGFGDAACIHAACSMATDCARFRRVWRAEQPILGRDVVYQTDLVGRGCPAFLEVTDDLPFEVYQAEESRDLASRRVSRRAGDEEADPVGAYVDEWRFRRFDDVFRQAEAAVEAWRLVDDLELRERADQLETLRPLFFDAQGVKSEGPASGGWATLSPTGWVLATGMIRAASGDGAAVALVARAREGHEGAVWVLRDYLSEHGW